MSALLMETTTPRSSAAAPATRSMLATCINRCAAHGIRLIVQAPSDQRAFARGLRLFPERRIDPSAHVQWDTAYRLFHGSSRQPHERGSWRILAANRDDRVVGAITARFFCGEIVRDYVHIYSLIEPAGPVFREHCELAVRDVFSMTTQVGRTPAEFSHWAVTPGEHAPLVAATLARALSALSAAFATPLAIVAADHHRGDVARLMRYGAAPLGRAGKFALPPFVHHASGAWLRFLLLDAQAFQVKRGNRGARDLALLRARCPIVSMA